MITKDASTLDRKQASRMLGVSVRTIDRYIHGGKLPAYSRSGRVLLKKSDVMNFANIGSQFEPIGPAHVSRPISAKRQEHFMPRSAIDIPVHVAPMQAPQASPAPKQDHFYKDLYDESKKVLTEYHQKLEQANTRIGQLETQMASQAQMNATGFTRTLISNGRDTDSVMLELSKKDVHEKDKEIQALKRTLEEEQGARTIFAILTYLLMATIPVLWYLMR